LQFPEESALEEELAFLVQAGLSPYEAMVASTRAPAEFLGEADDGSYRVVGQARSKFGDLTTETVQYEVQLELDDSGWRYSRWSAMMGVTETTRVDRD
jgi:hypothetical protein